MQKFLFLLALALAGCMLYAETPAIKHSFAAGQYPAWRKGGELLEITQKDGAVALQASELSFARLILPLSLTPGRSYRIRVQGSGPMDIRIRRGGEGDRNDLHLQDVFKTGPVCEFTYTPPAEYPANIRLMLCPARRNTPALVTNFELIPLGQSLTQVPGLPAKAVLPPKVRGFVFQDGVLTAERAQTVKSLHGNFVRVRLRDAEDSRAEKACQIARKYGLRITLEFMDLKPSAGLARLLKNYRQEIWGVLPAGASANAFRKEFPSVRMIRELTLLQPSELLTDSNTVYSVRVKDADELRRLKSLLARYAVAVLVTAPAEMSRDLERENMSFALDVNDATLPRAGVTAERELVKNATAALRQESLIRAVKKVRKPDSLIFPLITDTHYQSQAPFSETPYNYSYKGSLSQMQSMADLGKAVKADFVGHCGDVLDGIQSKANMEPDLKQVMEVLQSSGRPVLVARGNHDDGSIWCFNSDNARKDGILTQADWFRIVTEKALAAGAVGDPARPDAGYYYMDFPGAKTRVIVLNCSENPHTILPDGKLQFFSIGITDVGAKQINGLASTALDFRNKADRKDWGVLIICHSSLVQDTAINAGILNGVVDAFLNGTSYTGESYPGVCGVDPGKVSCDFRGQGAMKIYGYLYGHKHRLNRLESYLHKGRVLEICFPTALAPQAELGSGNAGGFAMIVLNPPENKMYIFRYGRGSDEVYPLTISAE